jgi:DNA-directed RNA polymerase omega subunit
MILPNPDRLNRFNKYALVILAAKRARHLQEQGIARRSLVKSASSNPLTIALEEVAVGRLIPSFNPEPLPEWMEPEAHEALLTAEEFEEAMAKVAMAVEAEIGGSDNGHGDTAEAAEVEEEAEEAEEEGLESEEGEQSISDEVNQVLGLDEEEDSPPEESDQQSLFDEGLHSEGEDAE